MTPSGIEPATCRFIAWCLNHYATELLSLIYKVKFTLKQSINAQRESRSIPIFFLWLRHSMGLGSQHHAAATLPPGNIPGTHFTGEWMGLRAGLDSCGKLFPTGI